MINFDSVKTAESKKFNKWSLVWILCALNILGYAAAQLYFSDQSEQRKAETETVEFGGSYGATVKNANTLLNWGVEMLRVLRNSK